MNRIKNAPSSIKSFATRHKTAITVVAVGTVTTVAVNAFKNLQLKTTRDFIADRGLTGEFEEYLTSED